MPALTARSMRSRPMSAQAVGAGSVGTAVRQKTRDAVIAAGSGGKVYALSTFHGQQAEEHQPRMIRETTNELKSALATKLQQQPGDRCVRDHERHHGPKPAAGGGRARCEGVLSSYVRRRSVRGCRGRKESRGGDPVQARMAAVEMVAPDARRNAEKAGKKEQGGIWKADAH